jgi:haloacetate dehalogenase
MSEFFAGFEERHLRLATGESVRFRIGGHGRPVVLLHGHPRTHTTWHRVAPLVAAAGHTVVCPDLRGYGGSSKPEPGPDHAAYGKGAMASDVLALMLALGHERFAVAGHDRGSYVALRLALEAPDAVAGLAVLDSVPIGEALARADARFATLWWHWFFFAQPERPERAILADPVAWYGGDPAQMGAENHADFHRAIQDPATVRAMLEDYRAGLTVDRAADDADRAAGRRVTCPTLVVRSTSDDMEELYGDVLAVWRPWVDAPLTGAAVESGHHVAEENPEGLVAVLVPFLAAAN